VLVAVTPEGTTLLREDRRRREAWLAQHLRALSADELDVLKAAAPILERLAGS
jgi:DNA-binding MarR family transcriptional regulator